METNMFIETDCKPKENRYVHCKSLQDLGNCSMETVQNLEQELMQKKGTLHTSFIHYLTPSAPIETDEVTLHSVLLLGLWMCRECFQGVLLFSLLHDVSEWRVLAKYQRFIANRNEPESPSVHQE